MALTRTYIVNHVTRIEVVTILVPSTLVLGLVLIPGMGNEEFVGGRATNIAHSHSRCWCQSLHKHYILLR